MSQSSIEVEYNSKWLSNRISKLVENFGEKQDVVIIHCDNKSISFMGNDPIYHGKT